MHAKLDREMQRSSDEVAEVALAQAGTWIGLAQGETGHIFPDDISELRTGVLRWTFFVS